MLGVRLDTDLEERLAAVARGWTAEDEEWERLGVAWDQPAPADRRDAAE